MSSESGGSRAGTPEQTGAISGAKRRAVLPAAGTVLRYAIWFGLVTGLGAVLLVGLKKFVLDQITLVTPQVVWVSPLTFALLAVPAGLVLALAGRLLPGVFDIRLIVFILAAAGSASGLLIWGMELNDLAVIILSAGIGVQFGQLAKAKPVFFDRLIRRTMPVLVGVPVLLAGSLYIGTRVLERRALSRLPGAAEGAPNVLLIILDTVRAMSTGLGEGVRPTTPNLERFAATGITFDHAMSPTSWTLPSHASMFTGRPAHELTAAWAERLGEEWPTLAEYLRDRGYRTAGVVGNWFYCNSEWGVDRGFIHYQDYDPSLGHALFSTFVGKWLVEKLEAKGLAEHFWFYRLNGRRIAPDVRRHAVRWLERDRERPYFAFVNFYDAHDPYVAPEEFIERIAAVPHADSLPVRILRDGELRDANPEQRRRRLEALRDYEAGISYLDSEVGAFLADLEARGLLENTLVIITSDHGEEFSEHGRNWHGRTVYLPAIHVPLIVRLPDGGRAGERVDFPVTLTDLAASVVDVLGIAAGSPFPGPSFLDAPGGDEGTAVLAEVTLDQRQANVTDRYFRSLVDNEAHYIASDGGREELYGYRADPFEQNDLAVADSARLAYYRSMLEFRTSRARQ